jgi:hypothetical protein
MYIFNPPHTDIHIIYFHLGLAIVQSGAGGGIKLCARMGIKAKVYPPSEGRLREPVVLVSVLF